MVKHNAERQAQRLLVFAKAPINGHVKTRLQPQFTPSQSVAIHQALVEHCLATVSQYGAMAIELWAGSDHAWWQQISERYRVSVHLQCGNDLGERMLNAATDALSRADRVVIIGTDCPFITTDYLQQAFVALTTDSDAVLGPAEDGGYVLIGLNKALPALFSDVRWGSDQVLQQTRERLCKGNVGWSELQTLRDIDRPEDIAYLGKVLPQLALQWRC